MIMIFNGHFHSAKDLREREISLTALHVRNTRNALPFMKKETWENLSPFVKTLLLCVCVRVHRLQWLHTVRFGSVVESWWVSVTFYRADCCLSLFLYGLSLLSNVFSRHKSTCYIHSECNNLAPCAREREKATYTWSRGDIIHAGMMIEVQCT